MLGPFSIIGRTKKPHGNEGFLKIQLFEDHFEDLIAEGVYVFILQMGCHIPYQIVKSENLINFRIKFNGINSPEELIDLSSKDLFLLSSDLNIPNSKLQDQNQYEEFQGYSCKVINSPDFEGIINRIEVFPHQIMAIVESNNKEIYIPLNKSFIKSINPEKKIIFFELPQGLLSLND